MRRGGRVVCAALVAVAYGVGVLLVASEALASALDRGGAMLAVAAAVVVAVPLGVGAYRTGPGRTLLAVPVGMLVPLLAALAVRLAGGPLLPVWVPLSWPVWAAVVWWLLVRRHPVAPVLLLAS
jgi:hypothetical protein